MSKLHFNKLLPPHNRSMADIRGKARVLEGRARRLRCLTSANLYMGGLPLRIDEPTLIPRRSSSIAVDSSRRG
ncbi:hypothetical protein BDQ12DRAFT_689872 [Crucibulum laeve]|uniref:Uncharacterized protein n=1 Tax=Crucibulum laeve TaxID=68775 RepID=A0A5C3M002_9AGAR|nr:hypothetical protein BDQ12DRAFT_689872 [Crucibulum laeve]